MAITETYRSTTFGETFEQTQARARAARESEDRAWDRAYSSDPRINHQLVRHKTTIEPSPSKPETPEAQVEAEYRYLGSHAVARVEGNGHVPEKPLGLKVIFFEHPEVTSL